MSNQADEEVGPWNPDIHSRIPAELYSLSSMFRPENVSTPFEAVKDLADFSGLERFDVVRFRPERLVSHEMLVRVTADLSVQDGPNYEDLGISLRGMVRRLVKNHAMRHMDEIRTLHAALCQKAEDFARAESAPLYTLSPKVSAKPASLFERIIGRKKPLPQTVKKTEAERVTDYGRALEERLKATSDPFEIVALSALIRVVNSFFSTHGRLAGGETVIITLTTTIVANNHGSLLIGRFLDEILPEAIAEEGYSSLPSQKKPVVMNVKGASASGKSSMRALQRELAEKLAIPWQDFALISPDYWRKYLLDYDGLGEHYKYAGMLTGHELAIIDKKLDRHMAEKAKAKRIPHLLIDRFRFDSFSTAHDRSGEGGLLTRFGDRVFLFFMVTPPEETVERAWYRGLETGRYKAVEDLLYHNIEAYEGMPSLFFSWVLAKDRDVHFEFLDNAVEKGQRPRTIAFGSKGEINIVDLNGLRNIDRFKNVNIKARRREDVYHQLPKERGASDRDFFQTCIKNFNTVSFVHSDKTTILAQIKDGFFQNMVGLSKPYDEIDDIEAHIDEIYSPLTRNDGEHPLGLANKTYVVGA